jgi:hypothetical protein
VDELEGAPRRSVRLRGVVAGIALLAVASVAGAMVVDAMLPRPGVAFDPRPDLARAVRLEDRGAAGDDAIAPPERVLTSALFAPRIALRVGDGTPVGSEFCIGPTSDRTIVLRHVHSCRDEVRIFRPAAVDCGDLDTSPDAASFVAAMLARPDLGAVDLGGLADGGVPASLFQEPYAGRVIDIPGAGKVEEADDPGGCRLLAESADGNEDVAIRRDVKARLVVLDVGGEMVVVMAVLDGRGGDAEMLTHMLESVYDIRFG